MKTILSAIASIGICSSAFAQIHQFTGQLKPIDDSFVLGSFSGVFDQRTSIATVIGVASAQAASVDTKPIKDVKLDLAPNSGLIYDLSSSLFSAVNVVKTSESVSTTSLDVHGARFYVLFKNEFFSWNSTFKANATNKYTLILNSGSRPVAYGTFAVVPEPEFYALAGGLGLIGFSLFQKKFK